MAAELYTWQRPAADKLSLGFTSGHMCMANTSDTGTGKTLIALDVARQLNKPLLVSCPKAVKPTWHSWAAEMGVSHLLLDVVNPERISLGITKWWDGKQWRVPSNALLVFDEVHKSATGISTKFGRALALTKAYRLPCLLQSATLADSPLAMRSTGYLLGLHNYSKAGFYAWCMQNGCYKSPFHNGLDFNKGPKGREAMGAIHRQLADRMVRLKIGDIPGFPESMVEAKLFELSKHGTAEINAAYAEAARQLAVKSTNPLVVMLKAQQHAELTKVPLLVELARGALEEGLSPVVFINYKATMYALSGELGDVPHITLSGDDPSEAIRQANIDRFQRDEAQVAIVVTAAGGAGVSLHNASGQRPRCSFINPAFSASVIRQALGRIHRAGGSNVVQTFVLAAGTVEENVYKALNRKLLALDTLLDGDLMDGLTK